MTLVSNGYGMAAGEPAAPAGTAPAHAPVAAETEASTDLKMTQEEIDHKMYQAMVTEAAGIEANASTLIDGGQLDHELDQALSRIENMAKDQVSMINFWKEIFYNPIKAHIGDKASKITLIKERVTVLLVRINSGLFVRGRDVVVIPSHHVQSPENGIDDGDDIIEN